MVINYLQDQRFNSGFCLHQMLKMILFIDEQLYILDMIFWQFSNLLSLSTALKLISTTKLSVYRLFHFMSCPTISKFWLYKIRKSLGISKLGWGAVSPLDRFTNKTDTLPSRMIRNKNLTTKRYNICVLENLNYMQYKKSSLFWFRIDYAHLIFVIIHIFGNAWNSSFLTLVGIALININSYSKSAILFFKLLQNPNFWNILWGYGFPGN